MNKLKDFLWKLWAYPVFIIGTLILENRFVQRYFDMTEQEQQEVREMALFIMVLVALILGGMLCVR